MKSFVCTSDCMAANNCNGSETCDICGDAHCPDYMWFDEGDGRYYCEDCWDEHLADREAEREEEDDDDE